MAGYDGHRGWINYLAVDPAHRRQGFARALVAEAEDGLRDLGCAKINLQIRRDNHEAIAFYERLGFAEDAVVSMGKRLERPVPAARRRGQTVSQRPLAAERRSASSTVMFLIDSSSGIGAGPPRRRRAREQLGQDRVLVDGLEFDALGRGRLEARAGLEHQLRRPVGRRIPGVHQIDVALAAQELRRAAAGPGACRR